MNTALSTSKSLPAEWSRSDLQAAIRMRTHRWSAALGEWTVNLLSPAQLVVFSLIGVTHLGAQSPEAALGFIEEQEKPEFREGHNLPLLSHWRFSSADVAQVLADDWGYAVPLRVYPNILERLSDPDSDAGRIVRLARDRPESYSLQLVVAPAHAFDYGLSYDDMPEGTFYRDADGNLIDGEYHFSPLAPNSAFVRIGRFFSEMIEQIGEYAPASIILNGGEYGLKKPQFVPRSVARQDPFVMEAWENDGRSWLEFTSAHKARHERIVREVLLRAAPGAMYIHYSEVGGGHTRRNMLPDWEDRDFSYEPGVSDLAAPPLYYKHANSGFTGRLDMLTQLLNARAQEIALGVEYAYPWVSAGWHGRGPETIAETDLYEGFLTMCYMAGSLGATAAYFRTAPYQDPVDTSMPQLLALGRVHAFFSHWDSFLLNSRLLPGPERHRASRDLPAYEFPTGDADKRVLVRRAYDSEQWLIAAWAADGEPSQVEVIVPGAGPLELNASRKATVYSVEKTARGFLKRRLDY